jgi:arylformamidase
MKIFDVTVPISSDLPIYEGDPRVSIEPTAAISSGDSANVTKMYLGLHSGTHVDAPNHFIDGTRKAHELDLQKLIGRCSVIKIDDQVEEITPRHLEGLDGAERILFRTRNSEFWNDTASGFRTDFTYLSPEAARQLADGGVRLVGIDYLSVEKFGSVDFAAHKALLEREVVILEGLDLRSVEPGEYELISLPLKYLGGLGDGAPSRTVLISR